MAIHTEPGILTRLQPGVVQALTLLALSNAAVLGRLALAAAETPALRFVPPQGQGSALLLSDVDGVEAAPEGLVGHVVREIGLLRLTPRARAVAFALVQALEPTGWLGTPPARIARDCGLDEAEVLAVLAHVQRIDPAGLFARDLAECLGLQAVAAGQMDAEMTALLQHLPQLAKGDLAGIAAESGLVEERLARAARCLRGYDPKPGLRFGGVFPLAAPDLRMAQAGGLLRAELHPASAPRADLTPGPAPPEARALLAALDRRRAAILSVAGIIAGVQAGYLAGRVAHPAPLTSAQLAEETGLHQATVNRILTALTAETPRGTLPLRALIARPLREGGPTAEVIRARLAVLMAGPPQSDAALARQLGQEGLPVARRTVAKYRRQVGEG